MIGTLHIKRNNITININSVMYQSEARRASLVPIIYVANLR